MWPVIVLQGASTNATLACVLFDKFGASTQQPVYVCDNWATGLTWAQEQGYKQALFLKSGTIIKDWHQWKQMVDNYPHKGLVAHLIWHSDGQLHLDEQCWFMDIEDVSIEDLHPTQVTHPVPIRSDRNLHDDYTPLWIRPGVEMVSYTATAFGQGLISRQLNKNLPIVNWNNIARDIKSYLYGRDLDLSVFSEYVTLAQSQLWVLNNEPIVLAKKPRLVAPGSGLYWMLNLIEPQTHHIQIVDISQIQVKFCQQLWYDWDGNNYGEYVWNFIQQHRVTHYQLDNPNMDAVQKLQLKSRKRFVEYVNAKFGNQAPCDFQQKWQQARQIKTVDFCNDNLIHWVLENNIDNYDYVWCSNILNYKWTMLHNTEQDYQKFRAKLK